jgi:hypothetical protein
MTDKRWKTGEDGISRIFPIRPENIDTPKIHDELEPLGHDLPFSNDSDQSLFCIRDSIAICDPDDLNSVDAILAFEIRPESWTLIYTHTEQLIGRYQVEDEDGTLLDEYDYLHRPIEVVHGNFKTMLMAFSMHVPITSF